MRWVRIMTLALMGMCLGCDDGGSAQARDVAADATTDAAVDAGLAGCARHCAVASACVIARGRCDGFEPADQDRFAAWCEAECARQPELERGLSLTRECHRVIETMRFTMADFSVTCDAVTRGNADHFCPPACWRLTACATGDAHCPDLTGAVFLGVRETCIDRCLADPEDGQALAEAVTCDDRIARAAADACDFAQACGLDCQ